MFIIKLYDSQIEAFFRLPETQYLNSKKMEEEPKLKNPLLHRLEIPLTLTYLRHVNLNAKVTGGVGSASLGFPPSERRTDLYTGTGLFYFIF